MSFSSEVKKELLKYSDVNRHCKIAETAAIINFCGEYNGILTIKNEHKDVLDKLADLVKSTFDIDIKAEQNSINIYGKDALNILTASGLYENQIFKRHINPLVLNSACCRRAYIRGAFICGGSVCDPEKNYHLEFLCHNEIISKELMSIINSFEIESKTIKRKNYYVVYLKDGEQIVDLLNIMSAHNALLKLENMRVVKDVRNSVNRIVNCETANLNKTVSAAVTQRDSIEYIQKTVGLDYLSVQLKDVAKIRLEFPDITLKEIGMMVTPPVGKSGVNHRFKKIIALANNLREEHEKNVRSKN